MTAKPKITSLGFSMAHLQKSDRDFLLGSPTPFWRQVYTDLIKERQPVSGRWKRSEAM
jgi:hypothetical protein